MKPFSTPSRLCIYRVYLLLLSFSAPGKEVCAQLTLGNLFSNFRIDLGSMAFEEGLDSVQIYNFGLIVGISETQNSYLFGDTIGPVKSDFDYLRFRELTQIRYLNQNQLPDSIRSLLLKGKKLGLINKHLKFTSSRFEDADLKLEISGKGYLLSTIRDGYVDCQYEFDQFGNIRTEKVENKQNGNLETWKYQYRYDEDGNWTEMWVDFGMENKVGYFQRERYE